MSLPSKEAPILEGQKFSLSERLEGINLPPELKEIKGIEALKKENLVLEKSILDENGTPLLENSLEQKKIIIKLPLSESQINQAIHLKVIDSLRWLAEWAKRLLKITGGKFIYKT